MSAVPVSLASSILFSWYTERGCFADEYSFWRRITDRVHIGSVPPTRGNYRREGESEEERADEDNSLLSHHITHHTRHGEWDGRL
jgi:hypothetical protein